MTVVLAAQTGESATNSETVRYLNRLSDLLFVLSRVANDDGEKDVKWVPGASRAG
jgi:cob(I)alamin adenosyltransferase